MGGFLLKITNQLFSKMPLKDKRLYLAFMAILTLSFVIFRIVNSSSNLNLNICIFTSSCTQIIPHK
jgi:hypothetical protein